MRQSPHLLFGAKTLHDLESDRLESFFLYTEQRVMSWVFWKTSSMRKLRIKTLVDGEGNVSCLCSVQKDYSSQGNRPPECSSNVYIKQEQDY